MEISHSSIALPPATKSLANYLAEFEAQGRSAVFNGPRYRIGYTVIGSGEPLYLVSGICSTRRLFAQIAVELADTFRVVLYDLPGVSDRDGCALRRYGLDDFSHDLIALADHLGDERIPVMGFSFGSTIAIRTMAAHPCRVPRAMLVGAFARRPLLARERFLLNFLRFWPGRLRHIPGSASVSRYNHGKELAAREADLVEFHVRESDHTPVGTAAMQALAVAATDLREAASRLSQPVFVFHGEQDRLVGVDRAAELANLLANVRVMVVPGCAHVPHLSHPDLLAKVARDFFSSPDEALALSGHCSGHCTELGQNSCR